MASLCSTVSIPSSRSPGRCGPSVAGWLCGGLNSQCRFLSGGSTFECRIQPDRASAPSAFQPALEAPHADDEIVLLDVLSLVQVLQNADDLPANKTFVLALEDHAVRLRSRELFVVRPRSFAALLEQALRGANAPVGR